jgi:DNA polymerase-3 subunit gamma/tau
MSFDDLVGQDHVARTLSNAIDAGRVAHAFLFTGVRGVGKTTSARILAKALNCMREPGTVPPGDDPGPTAAPCLKCPACLEIAQGTDVDVREIDGASYNGVDEVRKLQDALPYRPSRDRYKVYVVDEVHMLSQQAWNAFLKTLEEPPPHVKFIFATTEAHRIPITILSRVQRFDFKLIPSRLIAERLRHVLSSEGIAADDEAVSIVAREAAGSMRDAMSLLDQVIAWGGLELHGADVARVLGVASRQILHDLSRALVAGDAARCLDIVSELASQGYDMSHVARDLLALLRDLVVAKVAASPLSLLDLPDDEQRDVIALAQTGNADDLVRLHQGFSQCFDQVARSGQPRAALEMLLVRLARRPPLIPIDDIVGRLAALERRLAGGRPAGPAPQGGPRVETGGRAPPPPPQGRPAESRPRSREHQTSPSAAGAPRDRREEPPGPAAEPLDDWRRVVNRVRALRPELGAFLDHAAPLEVRPGQIRIGWEPGSIFASEGASQECVDLLGRMASEHFGEKTAIDVVLESAEAKEATTLSVIELEAQRERARAAAARVREHPSVVGAVEVLGARLKELKIPE